MRRMFALTLAALAVAMPAEARRSSRVFLVDGAPAARVAGGAIRKAPCASAYRGAARGSRWTALDFWGQPVGVAEVAKSAVYEPTGCRELELRTISGGAGVGVHVLGAFTPRVSFACGSSAPRAALVTSLRATVRDAKRVDLFCTGSVVRALATGRSTHIFHLDASGRWIADVVASEDDDTKTKPWVIADMNGDGAPEIVIREEHEDTYEDVVWTLDARTQRWRRAVVTDGSGYA